MKKTAIIGGGAAGLMAACLLARAGLECTLLEKQPRVGRKLLSTGNGRCNLSNFNAKAENYHGSRRHIEAALRAFPPKSAVEFFEEIGVECVADEEGRVYPLSNQAAGVLDALRLYADEHGVQTLTEFCAEDVRRAKDGYLVRSADGRTVKADFVIVACGGLAAPKLGGCGDGYKLLEGFGHRISPKYPAIVSLKTDAEPVRGLKGIRARCEISLLCEERLLRRETGEILFSENGVSGIAAMQLARDVNLSKKACALRINFLPGAKENCIGLRAKRIPERSLEDFLSGVVPKRLGQTIVKAAGVPLSMKAGELSEKQCRSIFEILTGWTLNVRGTLSFDQAQVTCGGALLNQFDISSLESENSPNLFAAGEVLDVDGDCGGYNLHWAWASAYLATGAIIRRAL